MPIRIARIVKIILAASWPIIGQWAAAQTCPQTTKVVVPFSPGTGMDLLARTLGPKLSEMWGQSVVVENKPGASGNLGTYFVVKAAPDGCTLMMGASTLVINPALYKDMQFNPLTDLAPVGLAANAALLLVVNPKTGITTARDLVERSKEKPGTFNYGSPGVGTPHHMAMELFKAISGASLTHIPFSASGPAVTQLLGGEVPIMFLPVHVAIPYVKAGKLTALATGGARRTPLAPDIPTLGELGFRDADTDVWYAMWAPAGTPPATIAKIDADMQKALALPEVRNVLAAQGMEVLTSSPSELQVRMQSDAARWAQLVKRAGIQAE
ncbi:MAG TPA: tripartite tricarboxylate transporter substrate binding protein [Usitatibacter sp.]|nr:tripartite tricarboxylate transporter substrate binding protein [Usitatibacter sp.]